ncbi:hypothetical protein ARMGADRAFT_672252 [Armillaria gallica]|uniref:Uncharacterized protein n=1 Tax=Armillaria gallica TaxID=47427 RepID=A0A2H3CWE4_ARMGA|nr:hypothetical protein ARMGADRAFT_672252 [Armillaria gallica]
MSCCEALSVWVRCLDKHKLVIIALWAIRAMLNHPERIQFLLRRPRTPLRFHASCVIFLCCFPSSVSSHRCKSSSSAEEPVVLKLCFTGRSSSYSNTYVVKEGRKLSNTTENPVSTHCRFAPNMITMHSAPAAASGLGFTALETVYP